MSLRSGRRAVAVRLLLVALAVSVLVPVVAGSVQAATSLVLPYQTGAQWHMTQG